MSPPRLAMLFVGSVVVTMSAQALGIPVRITEELDGLGWLSIDLDTFPSEMSVRIFAAGGDAVGGVALLAPDDTVLAEMRARGSVDGGVERGRLVSDCWTGLSMGQGLTDPPYFELGVSGGPGCNESGTVIAWMTGSVEGPWRAEIDAAAPTSVLGTHTESGAFYADLGAARTGGTTLDPVKARVYGLAPVTTSANAQRGFFGAFEGWTASALVEAYYETADERGTCPCSLHRSGAASWTFGIEGPGVGAFDDMVVWGIDGDLPASLAPTL